MHTCYNELRKQINADSPWMENRNNRIFDSVKQNEFIYLKSNVLLCMNNVSLRLYWYFHIEIKLHIAFFFIYSWTKIPISMLNHKENRYFGSLSCREVTNCFLNNIKCLHVNAHTLSKKNSNKIKRHFKSIIFVS